MGYMEHAGITNQIKQPEHASPALCYLNVLPFGEAGPAGHGFAGGSLVSEP